MKTTVNAHFRQMPTQEAQKFCCTRNYTHAGVVRSTQMTLRLSDNQWCVCRASKFLALGSMVAITPRLAKENGYEYTIVAERPPVLVLGRPCNASR